MLTGTLAFAAGIYALLQCKVLPSLWLILPFLLISLPFWRNIYSRILFCFCLGFAWACIYSGFTLSNDLPVALEQQPIIVEGVVASVPEHYARHSRFQFMIERRINANGEQLALPLMTRLNWYQPPLVIQPGQRWRLELKLKRPYGFMNPGGFDYELWLLRKGIRATGYVRQHQDAVLVKEAVAYPLTRLRSRLANAILQQVEPSHQGLVLALALGERYRLSSDVRARLNDTGTSHLIAISGLHLGLIATLVWFVCCYLWRQSQYLTGLLPATLAASVLAFAAATFYALLAGFSLPTQRALIMLAVILMVKLIHRPMKTANILSIAACIILILDPFALLAADFWLSFLAVGIIFYVSRHRHDLITRSWLNLLKIQLCLSIALIPALLFWFNQFPLYSLLANLFAIPLIGLLVVPLCLLAVVLTLIVPDISLLLFKYTASLLELFWSLLGWLAQLPAITVPIPSSSLLMTLLALVGICLLLLPRGLPARLLALVWLLPLLLPVVERPTRQAFSLTLLDVGQGLASVVQTASHTLVFDAGAEFSPRFNIGDAVVLPYLKQQGIKRLDTLLISHGDNDHIGGAAAILKKIETAKILSSVPESFPMYHAEPCLRGQHWNWDGVDFTILHPGDEAMNDNNRSCVLKIESVNGSLLLTGDIERQAENLLLKTDLSLLRADVLVVPHHGSRTSSSAEFIEAVSPSIALFAAGYRNRFGFPKQDIIARYESRGIETRTSYVSGGITLFFHESGLRLNESRNEQSHFWHSQHIIQ